MFENFSNSIFSVISQYFFKISDALESYTGTDILHLITLSLNYKVFIFTAYRTFSLNYNGLEERRGGVGFAPKAGKIGFWNSDCAVGVCRKRFDSKTQNFT